MHFEEMAPERVEMKHVQQLAGATNGDTCGLPAARKASGYTARLMPHHQTGNERPYMLRLIGCITLAFALSACMTPQQRTERMESDFGAQCRQAGNASDSGEYKRCLQMRHNAEVMDSMPMPMGI